MSGRSIMAAALVSAAAACAPLRPTLPHASIAGDVAALDAHPTPALADELVATWLARAPQQIAPALEAARLDTLCEVGAALVRRDRVDVLDPPRQVLARRCSGDRKYRGESTAVMVAAAALAMHTASLARTTPATLAVVDKMSYIAVTRAVADADIARLLAEGLLQHIDEAQFLAEADGRTLWLLAMALHAPTVDVTVVRLALELLERTEPPETANRAALAAELAARWEEDGAFLYLNDELWVVVGDEARPPLIRLDTWAKFLGTPVFVHAEERVAPAWWRARPLSERTALAAESQRRRYHDELHWIEWLREQLGVLSAPPP